MIIHITNAPAAIGPYSQVFFSPDGKTLYVSGCIGIFPPGSSSAPQSRNRPAMPSKTSSQSSPPPAASPYPS